MKYSKVLLVLLPLLALISQGIVFAEPFDLKPPPAEALMAPPRVLPTYDLPLIVGLCVLSFSGGLLLWKRNTVKAISVTCLILLSGLVPIVFADYSFGEPLTTAGIGLICYYQHTGFTLADTASGFESYTDQGNYYDGVIRLYIDGSGNTYTGDDYNWLVNCRVRADGWILTWLNATQEDEYILYDAKDASTSIATILTDYWTSLGRAMNRIFYAASEAFPGYNAISYYDYSETSATKMVFGQWGVDYAGSTVTDVVLGTFMVPSTRTIQKAIVIIHAYVKSSSSKTWAIDGDTLGTGVDVPTTTTDWLESYDIEAYIEYDAANNFRITLGTAASLSVVSMIVVLWLS